MTELDPANVVTIPGTNMKAGVFSYRVTEEDEGEKSGDWAAKHVGDDTNKAGILVPGDALYYLDALDPSGNCHFGVYKNFFLIDCFIYGSSHNRIMYMFRYGKKIELIALAGGPGDDFFTATVDDDKPDTQKDRYKTPTWMKIKDVDNDGNPDVRVKIFIDKDPIALYMQIKDDDLFYNLNPAIYKPLFEKEKKKSRTKKKSDAYYVYGFLSRTLTLDEIKAELMSDKRRYKKIVTRLLEQKYMQIPDYQDPNWIKPTLTRYDLKGR